ncbi:MAG: TIGR02530 family flagellar biosynthesis protein [Lachnospiraceae bacterium]
MQINQNQFLSIEQLKDQYLNKTKPQAEQTSPQGISFQDILNQKSIPEGTGTELKFSKHAANRLAQRNIELTKNQLERLSDATKKADLKGIQESLVIVDDLAFIVNIPSSTVVTAMDQAQTQENIFTNIDGAVII